MTPDKKKLVNNPGWNHFNLKFILNYNIAMTAREKNEIIFLEKELKLWSQIELSIYMAEIKWSQKLKELILPKDRVKISETGWEYNPWPPD